MATLRVILKQRLLEQEIRNTFHYGGGDATQTNAQGIGDYIRSLYATHLAGYLSTSWRLHGFSCKELDIVSNPTIDYTFTAGVLDGTAADDPMPTQVCKLVSWLAYTARPNRGRTYLGGFCETGLTGGKFTQVGLLNGVDSWATDMLNITATYPGAAMVIARTSKPAGILVGSNLIDTYRNPGNPAIQRRRRVGQGS